MLIERRIFFSLLLATLLLHECFNRLVFFLLHRVLAQLLFVHLDGILALFGVADKMNLRKSDP